MRRILIFMWWLLAVPADATPSDGYVGYSGTATARHASKFLYAERHVLHYEAGRLARRTVLYTCRDGTPFARKVVNYVQPEAPDFLLDDVASGLREGISSDAGQRTVFFRASAGAAEKRGPLPAIDGLVADAGFDEFVRRNWSRLSQGEAVRMHFLIPNRLDYYSFQAQRLRTQTLDGTPTEVFRLRLSGIWGWFLPGIDVYYSEADHELVHYDGLSDLRDVNGDNFQTEITFNPGDRKPSTEQAMRDAERVPLSRCP